MLCFIVLYHIISYYTKIYYIVLYCIININTGFFKKQPSTKSFEKGHKPLDPPSINVATQHFPLAEARMAVLLKALPSTAFTQH